MNKNTRCDHCVVSCLKCAKSFMQELETLKYKGFQSSRARLEAQDKFSQVEKRRSGREKNDPSETLVHMFGNNDEVIDD